MKIKIRKLDERAILPKYAHGPEEDAGMDLYALDHAAVYPGEIQPIRTGIAIELPSGYEAQIRPRSGLAAKGITVANAPGTIDPGYRGEIKVLLANNNPKIDHYIKPGDRIAQMVISKYEAVEWEEGELAESERGEGGFGSSGR